MTARYFPVSISSFSRRTFAFVYFGIGSVTRLSPIQRLSSARIGTCHMKPRSVSMKSPPGFRDRLHA